MREILRAIMLEDVDSLTLFRFLIRNYGSVVLVDEGEHFGGLVSESEFEEDLVAARVRFRLLVGHGQERELRVTDLESDLLGEVHLVALDLLRLCVELSREQQVLEGEGLKCVGVQEKHVLLRVAVEVGLRKDEALRIRELGDAERLEAVGFEAELRDGVALHVLRVVECEDYVRDGRVLEKRVYLLAGAVARAGDEVRGALRECEIFECVAVRDEGKSFVQLLVGLLSLPDVVESDIEESGTRESVVVRQEGEFPLHEGLDAEELIEGEFRDAGGITHLLVEDKQVPGELDEVAEFLDHTLEARGVGKEPSPDSEVLLIDLHVVPLRFDVHLDGAGLLVHLLEVVIDETDMGFDAFVSAEILEEGEEDVLEFKLDFHVSLLVESPELEVGLKAPLSPVTDFC